ncbi:MAG: hypothetical protein AB2A00_00630 [Myxococcota bacterium]
MRCWLMPTLVLALMVGAVPVRAAGFDALGRLQLSSENILSVSFEDPEALLDAGARFYDRNLNPAPIDAQRLQRVITLSDPRPLEGEGYVYIEPREDDVSSLGLDVPSVDGRVEVTVWVRAEPMLPALFVVYSTSDDPLTGLFATVTAVATGRRTSDDWVELSTGPVDGAVLGIPLKQVVIQGGFSDVVFDALEVKRVGDRAFGDDTTCTQANVASQCGEDGECIFGACVDSAVVWGAVPYTPRHRREYLDRLTHIFTRVHANRSAVQRRGTEFAARLAALAHVASPRRFWGGVADAVHFFRDHHTSAPVSYAALQSSVPSVLGRESSGVLGACFGLTELDLLDGGAGFTVFRVDAARSLLGDALRVGDVLESIEDEAVDTWLARQGTFGTNAPSDPAADAPWTAVDLANVLSSRASHFSVLRCESSTSCNAPTHIRVDLQPTVRQAVLAARGLGVVEAFTCDGRYAPSVTTPRPRPDDGSDAVSHELLEGINTFQFDGFTGGQSWRTPFLTGLGDAPEKVLFDTRLGNGGAAALAEFLVGLVRDQSSPQVVLGVSRPWHTLDPDGYYQSLLGCVTNPEPPLFDACSGTIWLGAREEPAVASVARIAWVTTADVSANDFVPRLLRGRAGVRILGPTPLSGAYGAIVALPPLLPGEYYGGSIQVHDSRFAASSSALATAAYESGTGVIPDETVIQKLSHSLTGRDTLITRARAWLTEAP